MDPTTLYRFYDADSTLLYIGIASNPGRRFDQHAKSKPWWPQVARSTMEHHKTRQAALIAERKAILTEHPIHNVVHNAEPGDPTPTRTSRRLVESRNLAHFHHLARAIDTAAHHGTIGPEGASPAAFVASVALTAALLPYADYCERCEFGRSSEDPMRYPTAVVGATDEGIEVVYACHICGLRWGCSWATETPLRSLLTAVDNLGRKL